MGRKTSRKHAFIIVYQLKFHDNFDILAAVETYLEEVPIVNEADKAFMYKLIEGTNQNLQEIDGFIANNTLSWRFERINSIDLAIIRLAVFEMKYLEDVPVSVAIDEALNLAKIYAGEDSIAFINGILGKIAIVLNLGDYEE